MQVVNDLLVHYVLGPVPGILGLHRELLKRVLFDNEVLDSWMSDPPAFLYEGHEILAEESLSVRKAL